MLQFPVNSINASLTAIGPPAELPHIPTARPETALPRPLPRPGLAPKSENIRPIVPSFPRPAHRLSVVFPHAPAPFLRCASVAAHYARSDIRFLPANRKTPGIPQSLSRLTPAAQSRRLSPPDTS